MSKLDILVNNAGVASTSNVETETLEKWRWLQQPVMLKTGLVQRVRRVARREGSRRRAGPRAGRDGAALSQRARR
ncbi:hypothetical protein WME91_03615 [Sorangium sp. So ce269]